MKTILKTFAGALLFMTFFYSNSFAQDMAKNQTVTINNGNVTPVVASIMGSGNSRIDTRFAARFPAAENEQWSKDKKGSWVSFTNEGRKLRAGFTRNGQLNYIIATCTLNQLPTAFQNHISKNYEGYQLINAIEIEAFDVKSQQAILETTTGFITLAATNEGIEVIQKTTKTN